MIWWRRREWKAPSEVEIVVPFLSYVSRWDRSRVYTTRWHHPAYEDVGEQDANKGVERKCDNIEDFRSPGAIVEQWDGRVVMVEL